MAQLDDVMTALRNADASGNHEDAVKLAAIADKLRGQQTQEAPQATAQPTQPTPAKPLTKEERFKNLVQSENPLEKAKTLDQPSESQPKTLGERAGAIGTSTAIGAAVGALSPEIVTGLGIAASFIPIADVAAPALLATGQAMRAGRLGAAAMGAASGLTSETAGQIAEVAGASKGTAEAARLVGGGVPSVAAETAGVVSHFVPGPLKTLWGAVRKAAGQTADSSAIVKNAKEFMAKMSEMGQPQTAMHAMLQKGIETDRQASEKAAQAVMQKAHEDAARIAKQDTAAATKLVQDSQKEADRIRAEHFQRATALDKASGGKLSTANRVLAQAGPELNKVGQATNLSDIGGELRKAAVANEGAAIEAKNKAYKAVETERDAIVAAKEKAGQSIDSTPSMKALKRDLAKRLGKVAGFEQTTDQGVRRGLQQVEDAITRRPVESNLLDAKGNPIIEPGKTAFEAIDHVRRRLGQVMRGEPAEGYEAIGEQAAKRMYFQLGKAQEEFVEADPAKRNVQRELQGGYSEAMGELTKFGSKAGQKATAVQRLDLERFNADEKTLPGTFFNSRQSVKDIKELTGNPVLVEQQARNFAARSLQGKNPKGVQDWINANSDWTREIPGLDKDLQQYAKKRLQIENINDKLAARAKVTAKEAEAARTTGIKLSEKERAAGVEEAGLHAKGAVETQKRILGEGEKAASATQETAFAPAKGLEGILKSGEAPEAVNKLLTTGKPEQTRLAASYLSSQPGGQKVLEASVRQVMRGMNENTLRESWANRIKPMLDNGKMIPPERLAALEKDVNRILDAYKGKDKTSLIQKHIAAALATAANVGVGAVRQ